MSNSGKEKFLSEAKLMRRLQHRNLVRLIGCSLGEEDDSRFLVYEYVTNQSLDRHLFGNASLIVYYSYIMSWRFVIVLYLMSNIFPFYQIILISLLWPLFLVPCCFISYYMYPHVQPCSWWWPPILARHQESQFLY